MSPTPQLADAVEHALRAPSVHNTQPWRWRIDNADDVVELYADRGRHLPATDPDGRDLLISCGAALDHLRVALAHAGLQATTQRFPDPENSTHLATVQIGGTRDAEPLHSPICSRPSTAATPTDAASAIDRPRRD